MPRRYPAEFRARAVALVRSGRTVAATAADLGMSQAGLHKWVTQDRIDRGDVSGTTTSDSAELRKAKRRIRELENELDIVKRAARLLDEGAHAPKGFTR